MEKIDYLINELIKEDKRLSKVIIPKDNEAKKVLYRALRNIREPKRICNAYLFVQDEYLQEELKKKKVTNVSYIKTIDKTLKSKIKNANIIALWKGDITLLKIDAIVNPTDEYLLGCFIPDHTCVTNAIHSGSGIELRTKCAEIMQGQILPLGETRITEGFNLPCKYIIHTVGPSVFDNVRDTHINILKEAYYNVLETARLNNLKTIAFPSLSKSEFNFPKDKSNKILLEVTKSYLKKYPNSFKKIVFNVYNDEEYKEFKNILH
jgi:O-acetyl-ADP-ribose deacetylase (regulator of RNase III)